MIIVKSKSEIDLMRESGKVTGLILKELEDFIKPGLSTADIDKFVEKHIRQHGMIAACKGYGGFPASACVSVNDEVVHGIPSKKRILREGDIVSVDFCTTYKGYITDAARTYPVGKVGENASKLIKVAKESFDKCLEYCIIGNRLSDISHAIQVNVESYGFGVIRDFVGHGIGQEMHEDPQIPNYGKAGRGPRLAEGMVLAIEPMITEGDFGVKVLSDDWTAVTIDGKLSAHYENTVVITDGKPELLTLVE